MAVPNYPTREMAIPFGKDGDKTTIPENSLTNLTSFLYGFQYSDEKVSREELNTILNILAQHVVYGNAGGITQYDTLTDYPAGALVVTVNNSTLYIARRPIGPNTSNGVQPVTNTTYWLEIGEYAKRAGYATEAGHANTANHATTSDTAQNSLKWSGSVKTFSTGTPSGGVDGDLWFQYI